MASHKLRELNKYIRALDVLTVATKSFRSCDQLLDNSQDLEVLKLEIQIQTVKHYLLRDEKDVHPTLTYIRSDDEAPTTNPRVIKYDHEIEPHNHTIDAFSIDEDQPDTAEMDQDYRLPGPPPKFQRKFSRTDLALEESESHSQDRQPVYIPSKTQPETQSLPSSFDEKKYSFTNLAEKFNHVPVENIPPLITPKSKSTPQSPRHRKSSSSRMRRSGSGRHKWDFFSPEAIAKSIRKNKNREEEDDSDEYYDREKIRSLPKNNSGRSRSNRGSNRSSKEKIQTPWDIVNTLNQNHQDLMQLVRVQEDSLAQINQILKSN
jgi:hypothetical protein